MIARLSGRLVRREPGRLVLDVGGVGYEVIIPLSTFYELPSDKAEVTLEIHTHVREDAITLFGFASIAEKSLFERLIGISGVGPKLACTLLSGLAPREVVRAIRCGEAERLQTVPGIGRKTAERIVLELKDKLESLARPWEGASEETPPPAGAVEDAVSALTNLGYREAAARQAVTKAVGRVPPPARAAGMEGLESLLRDALQLLAGGESARGPTDA